MAWKPGCLKIPRQPTTNELRNALRIIFWVPTSFKVYSLIEGFWALWDYQILAVQVRPTSATVAMATPGLWRGIRDSYIISLIKGPGCLQSVAQEGRQAIHVKSRHPSMSFLPTRILKCRESLQENPSNLAICKLEKLKWQALRFGWDGRVHRPFACLLLEGLLLIRELWFPGACQGMREWETGTTVGIILREPKSP